MKKIFTCISAALMAMAMNAGVVSLDLNANLNPASLEFGDNGIWTGCYNDVDYTWLEFGDETHEFMLSHLIDGEGASWGGYYWDGFTPAIGGDTNDYGQSGSSAGWTTMFGGCMAGGGCVINEDGSVSADPAQPYLVAYYSSWAMDHTNQVIYTDANGSETFTPVGVYVCNHPWPYYGCLHGDGFARAFEEGDYFELVAVGVAADGTETSTSINLVEFANGELHALNDWTFFDLSSLGEVTSVYFTLNSTDVGDYGMNTASYFCMDKFQVEVEDTPDPEDPYMTGYWAVFTNPEGEEEWVELIKGDNDEYVNTVTLSKGTYGTFNPEDESTRPLVPVYVVINGVRYGAEVDLTPAAYGQASANPLFEGENFYTLPAGYQYSVGVSIFLDGTYGLYVAQGAMTNVDELVAGKTVAGVRYFNAAGQEMSEANGLTIMVTTYTDGTTSTVKVIK